MNDRSEIQTWNALLLRCGLDDARYGWAHFILLLYSPLLLIPARAGCVLAPTAAPAAEAQFCYCSAAKPCVKDLAA